MINRWLEHALENRFWAMVIFAGFIAFGLYSLPKLAVDAVPDITNVQVVVNSKTGALDPEQIEQTVTKYIEVEMGGVPKVEDVRSLSKYGLSQVTVVFKEGTNIYWARQQVSERLQSVKEALPSGISPELAPITTGLGEVLMYVVLPKPNSALSKRNEIEQLRYLRTVQDTLIRPFLKAKVANVADVDSTGGFKKEIHIDVEPKKLVAYGITLEQLTQQLERLGENAGGGYIEQNGEQVIVRSKGTVPNLETLGQLPIKLSVSGNPIRLRDIAKVREDHVHQRIGASTYEGKEAVLGTVLMLSGANSRQVAMDAETQLKQAPLPDDVAIKTVYTRSFLVDSTIKTVSKNLAEGALLVVVVLVLILGSFRAALIVASIIPIAMLMAIAGMRPLGISANLMSLGAIDFGLLVDGAVVIVENTLRNFALTNHPLTQRERLKTVWQSVKEVIGPVGLGLVLIMLVYVPILSLEGIEGKLFKPMAITVLLALVSALVVTLFLIPVIASFVLSPKKHEKEPWVFRGFQRVFVPLINGSFRYPKVVLAAGIGICVLAVTTYTKMGSDFMPPLDEGDMVINMVRDSRISIDTSVAIQKKSEEVIRKFPGIDAVFSRMGTPESATDPMGPHLSDTFVILNKDHGTWPKENGKPVSKLQFFELIQERLEKLNIEQEITMAQPIEMRFNEILEGSRADVSLRIFGPDLNTLSDLSDEVLKVLESIKGTEIELDPLTALRKSPVLNITPDKAKLNLYGIHFDDVNLLIETAMSGRHVGSFYSENWRYPIVVRIAEEDRNTPAAIRSIPLALPGGGSIALTDVVNMNQDSQVTTIAHSSGKRYAGLSINLEDRDVQAVVKEAQGKITKQVKIPKDYTLEWGGQFENLHNAQQKLRVIIPMTLLAIFVLVFGYLRSVRQTIIVLSSIPFAVTGGIFSLYLRGLPLTVSAGIGFIALMGIAILNALVLITFVNQLIKEGMTDQDAIHQGVLIRLKPVLSTALVASLGFIPMALNTGMGAEVQRPLATVVIGGLITSTLLTLVVIPQLLRLGKRRF